MQRPVAGIVGFEGDGHVLHRRHQHGVADGAAEPRLTEADDLEVMAMQMHGMGHHRLVDERKFDPLALANLERHPVGEAVAVEAPGIGRHAAGEVSGEPPGGSHLLQRHRRDELPLQIEQHWWCYRPCFRPDALDPRPRRREDEASAGAVALPLGEDRQGDRLRWHIHLDVEPLRHRDLEALPIQGLHRAAVDGDQGASHRTQVDPEVGGGGGVDDAEPYSSTALDRHDRGIAQIAVVDEEGVEGDIVEVHSPHAVTAGGCSPLIHAGHRMPHRGMVHARHRMAHRGVAHRRRDLPHLHRRGARSDMRHLPRCMPSEDFLRRGEAEVV